MAREAGMEKKEFKKTLGGILQEHGFEHKNKAYYRSNDELIVVVAVQKSNFEDSFYLNYGFFIRKFNPDMEYPKENLCDVRGRFLFSKDGRPLGGFSIESGTEEELRHAIAEGLENVIMPVYENGLQEYCRILPDGLSTATLRAKEYLQLD